MIRKLGWMIALVALIAASTAAAAHARPKKAPKPPRGFYGLTTQTFLEPTDYRAMGRGKVGSLRVEVPWGDIEVPPPAEEGFFGQRHYRWNLVDPTVGQAARQGIRILPTVYGTPHWIAHNYQGCPRSCHKVGPASVEAYIDFALFMRALVQRYGPNGAFWSQYPDVPYKPIRVWQIWNEQNSSDFWKPQPSIDAYLGLLAWAKKGVSAVDPGGRVILGGMLGEPAQEGKITIPGWDFLGSLYARPGGRETFDGLSIHPYGANMRQIRGTVGRWREVLRDSGAARERIWVTELGWASGGEPHGLNLGLRGQAKMVKRSLRYFSEMRKRLNFAQVYIYSWRDAAPGADNCSWCVKSGLVRYRNRRPKPAWDVFRTFTGALRP